MIKHTTAIDKYLTCYDFNSKVSIVLEDYSKLKFRNAFYIKISNYYLIFTEHWGQFVYSINEVSSINQRVITSRQLNYRKIVK